MKLSKVLLIALLAGAALGPIAYKEMSSVGEKTLLQTDNAGQKHRPVKPQLSPFKFEDYPDKESVEAALKKYIYSEDPIEEIDRVLVKDGNSFRTDNLIPYKKDDSEYQFGNSSSENYVFYYKPSALAGKYGWDHSDAGWALKVTHMGSGRGFLGANMDMAPEGLLTIEVLSTPSNKNEKSIALVKSLLQDKVDQIPQDKFLHVEWDKEQAEFLQSDCKKDPSFQCLVEHSISVLDLKNNPLAVLYYPEIAKIVISEGDTALSQALLVNWPDEEAIRAFEAGLPRTKQYSQENIQYEVEYSSDLKMRLLYLAGDYQQADEILAKNHSSRPNGEDFGAIAALVKRGDLDKALAIAKNALIWPLEGRDPRENSSAIMHCHSYEKGTLRAESMGGLGLAFVKKGQYEKAQEVLQLLKTYIDNKSYGQKSYCHLNYAQASRSRITRALILRYAEQKDSERARKLLDNQISMLIAQNSLINNYNLGSFEWLAKFSAALGMREPLLRLTEHMQSNSQIEYTSAHDDQYDPLVVMLALAKQDDAAFNRMDSFDYSKNDSPAHEMDKIFNTKIIPKNEIKLNSLMEAAKSLKEIGDKEGAVTFLEKAHSMMGGRQAELDQVIENVSDYISRASIYYDLGLKDKSKIATTEIVKIFDKTSDQDYRGGQITTSFFGDIALLIAKHDTVPALQAWSDQLPYFYAGAAYAEIGKLLIQERRWDELDAYMPEMARVFSVDAGVPENWGRFTSALIEAEEFDRYAKFSAMVTKGNPADKKRAGSSLSGFGSEGGVEPKYTPNQRWLMMDMIVENVKGREIPPAMMARVMETYIEDCPSSYFSLPKRGNDKAAASDTMAACLLRVAFSCQIRKSHELRQQERLESF